MTSLHRPSTHVKVTIDLPDRSGLDVDERYAKEALVAGPFETKEAYLRHFDAEDLMVVKERSEASATADIERKIKLLDEGERQPNSSGVTSLLNS
jgi:hypothetical protein